MYINQQQRGENKVGEKNCFFLLLLLLFLSVYLIDGVFMLNKLIPFHHHSQKKLKNIVII